MAWYADLSPCDYFGKEWESGLKAVGWIEKGRKFTKGDVVEQLIAKLVEMLVDPWQPAVTAGMHQCGMCKSRFNQLRGGGFMYKNATVSLWASNLFVPGNAFLYVAPSGILHYLDVHEYAPPEEFCRAVLECPPMRSMPYLKSIRSNAPKGFLRVS